MDLLGQLIGGNSGGAVSQLSRQFGLSEEQTQAAVGQLLPGLAGGLRNQMTGGGGGLDSLLGMLGGNVQQYADDPGTLAQPETVGVGNNILGQLLGSKDASREVANNASAQTGIGADILKRMLPVVATMLMGSLVKNRAGASELSSAFGAGAGAVGGAGGGVLGMVSGLLDRNKDGSAIDDILRMINRK